MLEMGGSAVIVIVMITRDLSNPVGAGLYATFWPANPSPTRIDTGKASVGHIPSNYF